MPAPVSNMISHCILFEVIHEEFLVAVSVGEVSTPLGRMVVSISHMPYEMMAMSDVFFVDFISPVILDIDLLNCSSRIGSYITRSNERHAGRHNLGFVAALGDV